MAMFTPEELEDLRRIDEEIEENFELTIEEIQSSKELDVESLDDETYWRRAAGREYYRRNKERANQRSKQYYATHKDYFRNYKKAYYQRNKDIITAQTKAYRQAHREKYREYSRKYYHSKKEAARMAAEKGEQL